MSSRRFIVSLSTVLLSLTGSTGTTRAAITFRVDHLVVDSGELPATVGVEIFIDPGMPPWPDVAAFQVRSYLDSLGSGITIGSTGRPQTHTYLGPGSQPVVSVIGNRIDAGDISFTGSTPIFAEAGLLRVELVIPIGAPAGFYKLDIEDDPQFSFLADSNGLNIPINAAFGGVQIVDVVPGDYDRNLIIDEADCEFWRSTFGNTADSSGSGADGNRDGRIDAADYVVWRKHLSQLPGDHNGDGIVDAADYIVWRKNDGTPTGYDTWRTHFGGTLGSGEIDSDFNHDGTVDAADYVVWRKTDGTQASYNQWRTHFDQTVGNGSLANGTAPEPAALVILLIGMTVVFTCRRISVS